MEAFGAGERITFPKDLKLGFRTFAEAGDSGTVRHAWHKPEYYSVENDTAYIPFPNKFNCLPQDVIAERLTDENQ